MAKDKFSLRIALNELGGAQWTGGITYRNNLIKSLSLLNPDQKLFFVSKESKPDKDLSHLELIKVNGSSSFLDRQIDRVTRRTMGKDHLLAKVLKGKNIDILFPHSLNAGSGTKSIYWIPDFQFVHLPHLYTPAQLRQYNIKLKRYFADADMIVVSSGDAYEDFKKFSPEFLDKVRIMRFVAHVPGDLYNDDPAQVSSVYHLPPDFIYMPNQFWAHKNHMLVLEALTILREKGIRPFIVCSGNPVDVRDPLHLARFLLRLSEAGLRDQVAILGLIPHNHVYWLIRQSKCVLNPSLFEGWSTSVEESKSVGKRMILSDLNVHIEQDPPKSLYFKRDSAADLAEKLAQVWQEVPAGPDSELEAQAREALPERMKEFAATFLSVCEEAVNKPARK